MMRSIFAAFRHDTVANSVEHQSEIAEQALRYFGMSYNYSIDHKPKVYAAGYDKLRLHCSDLVERILIEANLKPERKRPSEALPIDIFHELISDPIWREVTQEYWTIRKQGHESRWGDDALAEAALKMQYVFLNVRVQQLRSAGAVSQGIGKIKQLLEDVSRSPEEFKQVFAEISRDHSHVEEPLKKCYREFLRTAPILPQSHVIDEISSVAMSELHSFGRNTNENYFKNLVTICYRWSIAAQAWLQLELPPKNTEVLSTASELIGQMSDLSDLVGVSVEEAKHEAYLFRRLVQFKATVESAKYIQLSLVFLELASFLYLIKSCAELQKTSTADLKGLLSKTDLPKLTTELLVHACVDPRSLELRVLEVDFAKLIDIMV